MPKIQMLSREYIEEVLTSLVGDGELAEVGQGLYSDTINGANYASDVIVALDDGTYASVTVETTDDSDEYVWHGMLARLDEASPGDGEWLVSDSRMFGSVLVCFLRRG